MTWTTQAWEPDFGRWFASLDPYEQTVLDAAIEYVLEVYGIEICTTEFGKPLGGGLYEFRVRQSLRAIRTYGGLETEPGGANDRTVLIRVFCNFYGDKVILLLSGLDKGKNEKAQQREIKKARKLLRAFQAEQRQARSRERKQR